MNSRKIVFYLPEGFADWEGAFLMAELSEAKRDFVTVSETGNKVHSIGRLRVQPDAALKNFSSDQIEMLILIGSDSWQDPEQNKAAIDLAKQLLKQGTYVAAICGATTALARAGEFEERRHTSNDLGMLKQIVPTYRGEQKYVQKLACTDGHLITASGIGPLEFSFEVLKALRIYSENKLSQWYAMHKNGVMPSMEYWTSI